MKAANKFITPPSYKATTDILWTKKLETSEKLKKFISEKYYSVTTDHWTSKANENYGAMTLHVINEEFQLKTFVLSCRKHENGACAEELKRFLYCCCH